MKRRSLTKVVALATVVSMMSAECAVYAEPDTNADTAADETTQTTTDSDAAAADNDSEETTAVANERLEHNYAVVSKGYKNSKYTGKPIVYPAADVFDADSSTALLQTDKDKTFDYGSSVVEMGFNEEGKKDKDGNVLPGKTATFVLDVEQAGVYAVGFDYLTNDEDSILVPEFSLKLNGESPFY